MTAAEFPPTPSLASLERRIGLRFKDRSILEQALCHTSYVNERPDDTPGSNERLEFLGDAIIGACVAGWLYRDLPDSTEGDLTVIRSALVREETLARWAREIDLGAHLRLGRGEEASGGRSRPALLSRVFEALVGAIFLDKGEKGARRFLIPFVERELESREPSRSLVDPKSRLQHLSQARFGSVPRYRIVEMGGLEHEPTFTAEVTLEADLAFQGTGRSKRLAEQAAATMAIAAISEQFSEDAEG